MPYIGKKPADIIATAVDTTTGDFSGNVTAGGTLGVTGETTLATHLNLGDNDKIKLGASGDLEVYHDGSNSFVDDTGTGSLFLRGESQVIIGNMTGEQAAVFNDDGAVTLNHDNSAKFATTSSGVDVTGTAVTDGLTVAGNVSIDGGTIKLDGNYPTGTGNVALGDLALDDGSLSGGYNTAIGDKALTANTSGTNNTALGHQSLFTNTTGGINTALGLNSLYSNTTAGYNTAVGHSALYANTTGTPNTAVGYRAGYDNTTGTITAVGAYVGYDNTTGAANVAMGGFDGTTVAALRFNTTGSYNTAMGVGALGANTTAVNGTAFGYKALAANTTGTRNVAVGYAAADATTTSVDVTAVGHNAVGGNTTGNGNTGVGTNALVSNTENDFSTAIGSFALEASTGTYNTAIGYASGGAITSGTKNTIIGAYNGNQHSLDIRTSSNYIVLSDGDGNPRLYINHTGLCRIPVAYSTTTSTSPNMYIQSDGAFYRSTSALKYKKDIRDLEEIDVDKFRPVRFKSKSDLDDQTKDNIGIIADEVHDAGITELVTYGDDDEVEGFQYERLTVVLLKAMQEQKKTILALEADIKTLKGE